MENFYKLLADLLSWYWWLTVVVFGIVINLASSYLKPQIDTVYGRISASRKSKNEADRQKLESDALELAKNSNMALLEGFAELRERIISLLSLIIGIAFTGLGVLVIERSSFISGFFTGGFFFGAATSSYIFFIRTFRRANNRAQLLLLARKKLSASNAG